LKKWAIAGYLVMRESVFRATNRRRIEADAVNVNMKISMMRQTGGTAKATLETCEARARNNLRRGKTRFDSLRKDRKLISMSMPGKWFQQQATENSE
jgi:hypothetical protein